MTLDDEQQAKHTIERRRQAYCRVFGGGASDDDRLVVLEDLAGFCRARESIFHQNSRAQDVLIGRNEVWKRIEEHTHLTTDAIFDLLISGTLPKIMDDKDADLFS